ncbi:MAG: hypothetical protein R2852_01580 [Bacteroidia bacterium]
MKTKSYIFVCTFILLTNVFSSCGVITRARYGNGLKLNIGHRYANKNDDRVKTAKTKNLEIKTSDATVNRSENIKYRDQNDSVSLADGSSKNPENKTKTNRKAKTRKLINKIAHIDIIPKQERPVAYNDIPIEPTIKVAAYLFYGGFLLSVIPYINLIAGIMVLVGFILANIGLRDLRLSGYAFRGRGLAISIIAVYLTLLIVFIGIILLFLSLAI